MTAQQMALLDSLFDTAGAIPVPQREAWLASHCDDAEVRAELESLLLHAGGEPEFSAAIDAAVAIATQPPFTEGNVIGPYRITQILGEGGMGTVYEGVRADDEFRHTVAIKALRMSTRSEAGRHRFLRERQILAELEHPNIARLFEGGRTSDGSPYIVMERIHGEPLTDFSNSRGLSIRQRLELFRKVAIAVQYAHQKLIIHRDIKPGNILVAADGTPKLLDFGIAKLMDDDTANVHSITATGLHLMTPDYASPEQVQGKPLTAASDVYSLGAVLYELLSGTRPHGLKTYDPTEIAERICTREIAPPSSMGAPALRGDLDTIVLKAMHKIPERRYNSAEQFSEDIRRYLEGLPVLARPDTIGYRTRKFARRHWVGLGATAAVILALSVGVAISMYQARLARERFELVRTLANRFLFDFYLEISTVSGTTKAQQMVTNTAVEYLDKLSQTAGSDRVLLKEMAQAYGRLADVQGAQNTSHVSRYEDALKSQRRSVEFYRKLAAGDPTERRSLSLALQRLSRIELILHRTTSGLEHSQEAARLIDSVIAASAADTKLFWDAANVHNTVALDLYEAESPEEALPANLRAQQYQTRAGNAQSLAGKWRSVMFQQNEAKIRVELGDVDTGIALLERSLRLLDEMVLALPNNRELSALRDQHMGVLAESYYSLFSFNAGDLQRATDVHKRRLETARRLMESDPADRLARMNMAIAESESATPQTELDPARAIQLAQSALARWEILLKEHPGDEFGTPVRARAKLRLALALIHSKRPREAIAPSQDAAGTFRELQTKNPEENYYRRNLVFALTISAQALAAAKRDEEARQTYAEAVELGEKLGAREHATLSHTLAASYAFDHFGDYWTSRGDAAQAQQWFARSSQAWAARNEQTPVVQRRRRQAEEKLRGIQP
jgi:serine/threonine protein kinase